MTTWHRNIRDSCESPASQIDVSHKKKRSFQFPLVDVQLLLKFGRKNKSLRTHLHRVQRHIHVDQGAQVLCDLAGGHKLQQALNSDHRVVLHQIRQLKRRQPAVVNKSRIPLQLTQHLLLLGR